MTVVFEKGAFAKQNRFQKFAGKFTRLVPMPVPRADFDRQVQEFEGWMRDAVTFTNLNDTIDRTGRVGWALIDKPPHYLDNEGRPKPPTDIGAFLYEVRMPCGVRFWYLAHPRSQNTLKHVGSFHTV